MWYNNFMNKCLYCGKDTSNNKFCSRSCSGKMGPRESKSKKPRNCIFCNIEFIHKERSQKFCSHSCSAKYNNIGRTKIKNNSECLRCGNKLNRNSSKYCSLACCTAFRVEEKINSWINGEWSGNAVDGLAPSIKKYLKYLHGDKCSICDWSEINPYTGKVPVEIDHIDGDCYNNRIENLRVVCPNCHSLSSNYRALNKGSGREYRRKNNKV